MLKVWERIGPKFLRKYAVRKCAEWMFQRFEGSDGLGAIYPSMQYSIMALDVLGYGPEHPLRQQAEREFNKLMVDDDRRGFYMQPCFSPVWDTAIATHALGESCVAPADAMRSVADWLLTKEVRRKGDWSMKRADVEPSGWAFEFNNEFYPDVDDTAMVLLAMEHAHADPAKQHACMRAPSTGFWQCKARTVVGRLSMPITTGNLLSHVPFADHNAMLDPSCPDITGRVIEALVRSECSRTIRPSSRGLEYLGNRRKRTEAGMAAGA